MAFDSWEEFACRITLGDFEVVMRHFDSGETVLETTV